MPNKIDKIAIADAFLKRSAKLLPCQKEMVLYWHNKGMSQRKLAAMFSVSRRLITFIIDPKKLERNFVGYELIESYKDIIELKVDKNICLKVDRKNKKIENKVEIQKVDPSLLNKIFVCDY